MAIGTHMSGPMIVVPVNPGSATPTTVYKRLFRRMVLANEFRVRAVAADPERMV